jgi:hypothetical protein
LAALDGFAGGAEEGDELDREAAMITRDMMPEITKLNLLNHFLSIEALPAYDKMHLIYEKILEELNESVMKHQQMQELERLMMQSCLV